MQDAGFGGALCEGCLGAWFPGRSYVRLVDWLGGQRAALVRNGEREEALRGMDRGNTGKAEAYLKKYGVWLAPWFPRPKGGESD